MVCDPKYAEKGVEMDTTCAKSAEQAESVVRLVSSSGQRLFAQLLVQMHFIR